MIGGFTDGFKRCEDGMGINDSVKGGQEMGPFAAQSLILYAKITSQVGDRLDILIKVDLAAGKLRTLGLHLLSSVLEVLLQDILKVNNHQGKQSD